jgi:hypothetical protein
MSLLRADVETFWTDSAPKDYCSNTVYFRPSGGIDGLLDGLIFAGGMDGNGTAQAFAEAWVALLSGGSPGATDFWTQQSVKVTLYDMAAAKPRPIVGTFTVAGAGTESEVAGNRAVACCLTFYGGRNLPRQRGRIYLGPLTSLAAGRQHFTANDMSFALSVATLLAGVQAVQESGPALGLDWVVYSPKSNETHAVTNAWCDDRPDVIRKRAPAAGTRQTSTPGS